VKWVEVRIFTGITAIGAWVELWVVENTQNRQGKKKLHSWVANYPWLIHQTRNSKTEPVLRVMREHDCYSHFHRLTSCPGPAKCSGPQHRVQQAEQGPGNGKVNFSAMRSVAQPIIHACTSLFHYLTHFAPAFTES
jgi:hypothetical protein